MLYGRWWQKYLGYIIWSDCPSFKSRRIFIILSVLDLQKKVLQSKSYKVTGKQIIALSKASSGKNTQKIFFFPWISYLIWLVAFNFCQILKFYIRWISESQIYNKQDTNDLVYTLLYFVYLEAVKTAKKCISSCNILFDPTSQTSIPAGLSKISNH